MTCVCRNCGCHYEESKSTADWKGFCSQKCVHAKAKALGYSKAREIKHGPYTIGGSEYNILKGAKEIGSVPYHGDTK